LNSATEGAEAGEPSGTVLQPATAIATIKRHVLVKMEALAIIQRSVLFQVMDKDQLSESVITISMLSDIDT
jgi:hypothetical protein